MAAVLAAGLPLFDQNDANRDRSVNLEDVILHMRQLTGNFNGGVPFAASIENTLSTLYEVAGLKASIQGDEDRSTQALFGVGSPFLVCSQSIPLPVESVCNVFEPGGIYFSIAIPPSTPPPRNA